MNAEIENSKRFLVCLKYDFKHATHMKNYLHGSTIVA